MLTQLRNKWAGLQMGGGDHLWEAVGAIAEILGSLTVVLTIAYLTVQIRQSGRAAKSVSTNQTRSAVVEVISAISSNTDAVKTYTSGLNDRASLEIHERMRFDLIIFQTIRASETIFLEYREGLVSQELWEGQWRGEQSILSTTGGRASWVAQKHFVSRGFMEWVDEHLDREAEGSV
ncbi:MAG: hypothetical protein ACI9ON_002301 [Limisphaerales bacterium]